MNNTLGLIGIAKKGGMLEIGEEPTGAAVRSRHAKAVFTASDAAANSVRRAAHFAAVGNVPHIPMPATKAELGAACGRSSCAMFAVTDAGIALSLAQKVCGTDPESAAALAALEESARRTMQRRAEKRAHEKKKRKSR